MGEAQGVKGHRGTALEELEIKEDKAGLAGAEKDCASEGAWGRNEAEIGILLVAEEDRTSTSYDYRCRRAVRATKTRERGKSEFTETKKVRTKSNLTKQ